MAHFIVKTSIQNLMRLSAVILVFCSFFHQKCSPVSAENILVYGIVGSYSQRISMWSLLEALSDKGHNVTYISAYDIKDPHPQIHDYAPKLWKERMGHWEEHMSFYDIRKEGRISMVKMWFQLLDIGILACESLYEDNEFLSWVNTTKFDLVIVDGLMNECAYSLVHFWKAKLIIYSTTNTMGWYYDQHGLPLETSSVPDLMYNFPRGEKMQFWQRFVNAMTPLAWKFAREFKFLPRIEEICKTGLGLEEMPAFTEIERNASLVMVTTHHSLEGPKSFSTNAIAVQGIALGKKLKPLPEDVEKFISKSKEGFIYISFGTVAEFTNFDKKVQMEFIQAIEKFPNIQFLWKSTFQITAKLPTNVMVITWAPQQSLLAHPNIKAFISHCGMGSTTEAIHFEVPIIALPVLAEQDMNSQGIADKSAGIKLEVTTLKQHELEHAINEVVYNPKYKKAMQRLSSIFKDRPMSATENALWWVEYVLRHENPHEFLTPPSVHQSWWVKRQIDVWLTAAAIVFIIPALILYFLYKLFLKVIRHLLSEEEGTKKTIRKNIKLN